MKKLRLLVIGFCMGFMEVIPAVSGGNVAVVTGVFDDIIHCLKEIFRWQTVKQICSLQWYALYQRLRLVIILPLGIGAVVGMVSMAHALQRALEFAPWYLWAFFTGVLLFAAVRIATMVKQWNALTVFIALSALVLSASIIITSKFTVPSNPIWYLITGIVVSVAVILPGISSSFVLLLLGQYERILEAVSTLDFSVLIPLVCGAMLGFIAFVSVLEYCLQKYHNRTYAALAGLVLGSLPELWPWTISTSASIILTPVWHNSLIIVSMALGALFMYLLTRFTKS